MSLNFLSQISWQVQLLNNDVSATYSRTSKLQR